jgi:general secretion pathway protein D
MTGTLVICALAAGCAQQFGARRQESISSASEDSPSVGVSAAADSAPGPPASHAAIQPRASGAAKTIPTAWQAPVNSAVGAEVVRTPVGTPAAPQPKSADPVTLSPPPGNGPTITLHGDDLDVRKTLETLSRGAGVNILVSPGVAGSVTVDLRDKTLDEVLTAIARLCNLNVRREKDVIYVSTSAELRKGEEEDLPVRVYHLNYVKSNDVGAMIKSLLSPKGSLNKSPESETGLKSDVASSSGGGGGGGSDIKAGGNSLAGGETLVVQDYEYVLKKVDRVIAQIDVQPPQVLIEAVIVSVELTKDMDLGVNFAMLDGAGKTMSVIGDGALINTAAGFAPATVVTAAGKLANGVGGGFAEDSSGLKLGWVGGSSGTTAFIRALEMKGKTTVLASPKLMVLNKQRAEIHVGKQLGYRTSTVSQTSTTETVSFMNIGTQLRLRPFVLSDGIIRMEIHPERSTGDLQVGIPQLYTSQVTTNVMIPDGSTLIIGGLTDAEVTKNWEGLPFLSRIPLLGYLFRHTEDSTTKRELVVILTPHIWRPECPDALNYLGQPNNLGLGERVGQRPHAEASDGPSLYELTPPQAPQPPLAPPGAAPIDTTAPIPMGRASSPVRK